MIIDPFSEYADTAMQPTHEGEVQAATGVQAMSLFELNARVHAVVSHSMRTPFWVTAELSEVRTASNGHCYVEFVQKDEGSGALVAKARGIIWRTNYRLLSDHFRRVTGRLLGVGIKVMVEVTVNFHELYGYSLNVININPTFTMGDLALRRREIINQLKDDGVMELNKELPLPAIISRVAIISSPTAAGYGDFCNQLQQSGLAFTTQLFEATMQGEQVEASVIRALDRIAAEEDRWDVVVIIRGGGAATDLGGFDSYLLASNVAQFPLPVLTGIGHERDDTIVDLVAHTRLKTPTAVAAFLIDSRKGELTRLNGLKERLTQVVAQRLADEKRKFEALNSQLSLAALSTVHEKRNRFNTAGHRFHLAASRYFAIQRQALLRREARIEMWAVQRLQDERQRLQLLQPRMEAALTARMAHERHRQEMIARSIRLAGPERILAMGFSITMKNGHAVESAAQLRTGDVVTTIMANGRFTSVVKQTSDTQGTHRTE